MSNLWVREITEFNGFRAMTDNHSDNLDQSEMQLGETPRHGFQGDRGPGAASPVWPRGVTIAVTREAGSRGSSIAQRLGAKLGWQVYQQDLLEYLSTEGNVQNELNLPADAVQWVDEQVDRLLREQNLSRNPLVLSLARTVLSLGANGEVILLGRGAGYILPPRSTVHVRLIAPLPDRIAYMSQWLRLTQEEAASEVVSRDAKRAEFLDTHLHCKAADVQQFDLVLNTGRLGEELCTELIVQAAQAKAAILTS